MTLIFRWIQNSNEKIMCEMRRAGNVWFVPVKNVLFHFILIRNVYTISFVTNSNRHVLLLMVFCMEAYYVHNQIQAPIIQNRIQNKILNWFVYAAL